MKQPLREIGAPFVAEYAADAIATSSPGSVGSHRFRFGRISQRRGYHAKSLCKYLALTLSTTFGSRSDDVSACLYDS
jgi:hypothetical protein